MFILKAEKNRLARQVRELLTSGSVNANEVRFEFSPEWEGLERTAVFKAGPEERSVLLDDTNECGIPWEVLVKPGVRLLAGVCGTKGGEVVLPTVWESLGVILEGVSVPEEESRPPTPDIWQQELARKADALDYTPDGSLGLYAGDKLLSAVPVVGGGEGGMSDHRLLSGRDAPGQHPISSIEGLAGELSRIPQPVEALTNMELEELLK